MFITISKLQGYPIWGDPLGKSVPMEALQALRRHFWGSGRGPAGQPDGVLFAHAPSWTCVKCIRCGGPSRAPVRWAVSLPALRRSCARAVHALRRRCARALHALRRMCARAVHALRRHCACAVVTLRRRCARAVRAQRMRCARAVHALRRRCACLLLPAAGCNPLDSKRSTGA